MRRYIKLIISDENGRSEDTLSRATDAQIDAARRCSYALMANEPVTDAEWAEVTKRVEEARRAIKGTQESA